MKTEKKEEDNDDDDDKSCDSEGQVEEAEVRNVRYQLEKLGSINSWEFLPGRL